MWPKKKKLVFSSRGGGGICADCDAGGARDGVGKSGGAPGRCGRCCGDGSLAHKAGGGIRLHCPHGWWRHGPPTT
jgi:hypothetical protein